MNTSKGPFIYVHEFVKDKYMKCILLFKGIDSAYLIISGSELDYDWSSIRGETLNLCKYNGCRFRFDGEFQKGDILSSLVILGDIDSDNGYILLEKTNDINQETFISAFKTIFSNREGFKGHLDWERDITLVSLLSDSNLDEIYKWIDKNGENLKI